MPLEGVGYVCTKLDLGYPVVREVAENRADQNGMIDRTSLFGGRIITIELTALAGAGARIDEVVASFAPFMDPSLRPQLHYILDRPGELERVITVRAQSFAWPIVGPNQRDFQLVFLAADPLLYDATTNTATAWCGATGNPGRVYDLTFDRTYPAGGTTPSTVQLNNYGDVWVPLLVRVHGPAQNIQVRFANMAAPNIAAVFKFLPTFALSAGDYVDIDSQNRIVFKNGDPTVSQFEQVDWSVSVWPYLAPESRQPNIAMSMTADDANNVTQVTAYWSDAYLT
jgi:hypothetical protein